MQLAIALFLAGTGFFIPLEGNADLIRLYGFALMIVGILLATYRNKDQ